MTIQLFQVLLQPHTSSVVAGDLKAEFDFSGAAGTLVNHQPRT